MARAKTRNPQASKPNGQLIITLNIDREQVEALDTLADLKRTSRSALAREAIDLFLATNIARNNIASSNREVA